MTRRTNATVAGITFFVYDALAVSMMILLARATGGEGISTQIANIVRHATDVRIALALLLFSSVCAVVLGVTLYAITRDVDNELAMMALLFRVAEGVIGWISIQKITGLLWLANAGDPAAPGLVGAQDLGAFVLMGPGSLVGTFFFAVGSVLFTWLLLRGRMIPVGLAWLGVFASLLMVVALPLQIVGILHGLVARLIWIPIGAFEIPLAVLLTFKGARQQR